MVWKTTSLILNSAMCGALLFGAGDLEVYLHLQRTGRDDVLLPSFRPWWPALGFVVVPLWAGASAANALAYRATGENNFLIALACNGLMGVLTLWSMSESGPATNLLGSNPDTKGSCLALRNMNLVRVAAALTAVGYSGIEFCPRYHPSAKFV